MHPFEVSTETPEETFTLARRLARHLHPGDVIALEGDLGAGKTTFTKGLAAGLGVEQMINSPTFTLMKAYRGRLPFYHFDAYRLEGEEDLGFEEYFYGEGVSVIEWASKLGDLLPEERLTIHIRRLEGDNRILAFLPAGNRYIQLCKEFFYADSGD